CMQALEFPLTS
nr:immunoglobulin light chain junction region [Macaca mulatta]